MNRQRIGDTIGQKVNGHFGAYSCSLEEVEYHRKGTSPGLRNIKQVLAV